MIIPRLERPSYTSEKHVNRVTVREMGRSPDHTGPTRSVHAQPCQLYSWQEFSKPFPTNTMALRVLLLGWGASLDVIPRTRALVQGIFRVYVCSGGLLVPSGSS